jgi:argininosuccinate synthase
LKQRIVLACSGSPRNTAAIPWLAVQFDAEIVALTLDIGQGQELASVRQRALAAGAVRAHVLDARDEFARDCVLGSLRTVSGRDHADAHALAHPLIARKLVEIARIEAATAIAHGGDAGDHKAIAAAAHAVDASICVIAAGGAPSAEASAPRASADRYSVHRTLWGRSIEYGAHPGGDELPEEMFALTASAGRAPDAPAHLEIAFEAGVPVAVNGVPMPLTELIESVTTIAGSHGIGRVTNTASRTACEAPAAVVLQAAHAALGAAARRPGASVRMELFRGRHTIVSTTLPKTRRAAHRS